jgi:hypothetical protein
MKKVRWVSATAGAALVAAMFALPGAGVAYASDNGNTTGNRNISILSGNSVTAPIRAPVNLIPCGSSFPSVPFRGRGSPHEPLPLMSRRNRLAQALFRLELRMCGLGV